MKVEKEVTKEQILDDVRKVYKKFKEEFIDSTEFISRDYYREHGKYPVGRITKMFGKFGSLKELVYNEKDNDNLSLRKRIVILEEKNKDLEKQRKDLLKSSINEDNIIDLYKREILPIQIPTPLTLTIEDPKKDKNTAEAMLLLSDWHCSEKVIPEEVNFANEFNLEILSKRVDRVFNYFIYYCDKFNIRKATLLFLGDLIAGEIHQELIRTNEISSVDTIFFLQELITRKLLEIEKYFDSIDCHFLVGNHGRLTMKPEYKTASKLNWEYVLAKQLKICFDYLQKGNKKININVSPSLFKIVTIAQRKFLVTHGNIMVGGGSGGFAGLPLYSLAANSAKMFGVLHQIGVNKNETMDDICIGHLHSTGKLGIFTGGSLFVNGSLVGTDEFSLNKMRSIAKIEQTMLIVNNGKVDQEIILRGEE